MAPERAAVVGTTAWGTTLAVLLARNGHEVLLLARTPEEARIIGEARENRRHRPGLRLPDRIRVASDESHLPESELIVIAVPSASLESNLERLAGHFAPDALIVSGVKGIEPETGRRMSQVIAAAGVEPSRIVALSGPNFSEEIAAGLPAAAVVAGVDRDAATRAQAAFMSATFRVYTSTDVIGVEMGGALKNVVAIACGISDGLGYGVNARAGLMTRALAEITRLGVACGAEPLTFLGLAGIGDLIATCSSDLSRNRRLGLALAAGNTLSEALAGIDGVVEGVGTTRAARSLAARLQIEMPITEALFTVLYEGKDPRSAVNELMLRAAKPELE